MMINIDEKIMLENLGEIKEHTEAIIKIQSKIIDYVCSSVLNRDKTIKKEENHI